MKAAAGPTVWSVPESATTSMAIAETAAEARAALDPRGIVTTLIDSLSIQAGPSDTTITSDDTDGNHTGKKAKTQDQAAHFIRPYSAPAADTGNSLQNAPLLTRNLLLTLHILFPHALLPALDLLDRGQVLRVPRDAPPSSSQPPLLLVRSSRQSRNAPRQQRHQQNAYSSRRHGGSTAGGYESDDALDEDGHGMTATASYDGTQYHEIRLDAWTCSCPAFAFAAFPAPPDIEANDDEDDRQEGEGSLDHSRQSFRGIHPSVPSGAELPTIDGAWRFGGLSIGTDLPVCKHLLAAVLGERCAMFRSMVKERVAVASPEEVAGWAAGWGG